MNTTLSPAAWARISALFDEALDLPEPDRVRWLDRLAVDDAAATVAHLRAMLAAHADQKAADKLERGPQLNPPADAGTLHLHAGLHIGPWRLVAPLGSGGMATVWRAARADGAYQREVALKMPLNGRAHWALNARFQDECSILARLEHPNIARLYDANLGEAKTDDADIPWLAIEQVDGRPLDRWCRAQTLSVPQRLALFIQVLDAVQCAHSHLVLHRDLKASNILVTADGQVKLLDFGIATWLQGPVADGSGTSDGNEAGKLGINTDRTGAPPLQGHRSMTPAFAAPEQIENGPLSTATDLYAAGVVLFDLLTGARPYRGDTSTPAQLEAAILRGDVQRASQACTPQAAASAGLSQTELRRQLTGDLDAILRKALQRDPTQRYESARAFAADLQRHLEGRPVRARPATAGYVLQRWLTRHRGMVGLGGVAAACVATALSVAAWKSHTAEEQTARALAAQAANEAGSAFMADLLNDAMRAGKPINADEWLARAERMARQTFAGKPDQLAAVLWMVSQRASDWDGHARSRTLVREALALARDPDLRDQLNCEDAYTQAQLGELAAATQRLQAVADHTKALPAARACALGYLAFMAGQGGRLPEALALQERAMAFLQRATAVPEHVRAAMTARLALFKSQQGHGQEGDRLFAQALNLMAESGREHSRTAWMVRNEWAIALSAAGEARTSLDLGRKNLELLQADGGTTPLALYTARGVALQALTFGDFPQAESVLARSLEQATAGGAATAELLRAIECDRAVLNTRWGRQEAAALDLARADRVPRRPSASDLFYDRVCRLAQAEHDISRGAAAAGLAAVTGVLSGPGGATPALQANARVLAARAHLVLGQPAEALAQAEQALVLARQLQSDRTHSWRSGYAELWVGTAQARLQQADAARSSLQRAVQQLAGSLHEAHPWLVQARQQLAAAGG